ncbi:DUF2207 domain-containing protein [Candidatus Saccharibacteria bacterium]|nr:DUF2207 domain-containing protein [Candidatus Saccharibacteria bacterium]
MKRVFIFAIAILSTILSTPVMAKSTDNFYFSDFTGDYYLYKDEEGISRLKVKESATAEFPNYDQNKGICRQIAFTNQDGKNVTLPKLTRDNLKLTRNGNPEPIYSIERNVKDQKNQYYDVCTGNNDYVLGKQTYTFEYEFSRVVTEFNEKGKVFQELYWDANGNGSKQRFDKVTARLHFEDEDVWTGESWCYVGKYGEKGSERCKITKTSDGVEFMASNLAAFENLSFDVELKAGSFVVPEPYIPPQEKNYTYVWITVGAGALCLLAIFFELRKFAKTREKARFYKGIFVKPEYQPDKYSLPEMAEVFVGKKKDVKVAMILHLVVKKKIEFQKADKHKWNILVKDLDDVAEEYMDLLSILNGGTRPKNGDKIELKQRVSTSRLIALRKTMENKIVKDLKDDKLVEDKYKFGETNGHGVMDIIVMSIFMILVVLMLGKMVLSFLDQILNLEELSGQVEFVFYDKFYQTVTALIVATVVVVITLSDVSQKYLHHTESGLKASRYMDGLKLYISMAEAERMKMLQSVEGADTSAEGIVRLYEKLLPYAAIFGLEESWMEEMKEYCELKEIDEPDYLLTGITAAELTRGLNTASAIANTSSSMSSSGGGSSSGFSGGGGGGFSGGGGGGGGFGGR